MSDVSALAGRRILRAYRSRENDDAVVLDLDDDTRVEFLGLGYDGWHQYVTVRIESKDGE